MAGSSMRDMRPGGNSFEEPGGEGDFRPGRFIVAFFLTLLLLSALFSCRGTRYVPVETVRKDSVARVIIDTVREVVRDARSDSVIYRDSIVIKEYVREVVDSSGRVIRTDREKEKSTVRDTERHTELTARYEKLESEYETLYRAFLDKKAEPYPVERELSQWEKFKIGVGGWATALLSILLIFLLFRVIRR